ncbi:MAG: cyclic 2,3-diphosphoglycerate synthase [Candidatus Scalindua sp.]|jgi:predicted GTPase|nr:cyclic 2,3-diphosphoglycerate synthase [Candidatus Scalindua sp.]|tara:strand:- start:2479 stop:3792 length:1314 start_codon:yes stop_codon:yes gene_type:complete
MKKRKTIIMGAAGRDFHNFNVSFKDNEDYEVVAFTATQIPNIDDRKYPSELAGRLYPDGIPIYDEKELTKLIKDHRIDEVVFSYSDVSHEYVMHKASEVQAAGANFIILGAGQTMLKSKVPVIAVCAVRTGCGKSAATRRMCQIVKEAGKKVVVIRHPMPYGELVRQKVQRFETYEDLTLHDCTIEEMEEYEPHIEQGTIVYAGVDYEAILRKAEDEADIIIWDGGNNDLPFYKPDVHITLVDPHRPGHEVTFYPGETNLILADIVIISKEEFADAENIIKVKDSIKKTNPGASVIDASLHITVENPERIKGRRVLAVEDGPTVTHGGMTYGAAVMAAREYGASILVDPRLFAVRSIKETFNKYPDINNLLPAMGYDRKQILELEETINQTDCDIVITGTPIDLGKIIRINKPIVRAKYELQELSKPGLSDIIQTLL